MSTDFRHQFIIAFTSRYKPLKKINVWTDPAPLNDPALSIITFGCIWFITSLILTLIYTLRLKKFIIREHEKAYDYLT